MSQDNSVGVATHYGLESPPSIPGVSEIFHTRPDGLWGPPWYRVFRVALTTYPI